MRVTYQLYCNNRPGYVITNQVYTGGWNDVEFRRAMASEFDVCSGEGYFTVMHDGEIVNKLDIPQ